MCFTAQPRRAILPRDPPSLARRATAGLSPPKRAARRRKAGKGDRALARWKGRGRRRDAKFVVARSALELFLQRQRSSISEAPSTMLRLRLHGPPPPLSRGRIIFLRSRDAPLRPSFAHATVRKPFPTASLKRREAERRQAHHGFRPAAANKACQRMRRALFSPLPRIGAGLKEAARSPFGAPPRSCAEGPYPRLGSGPRFLESPDPNGRTLSGTSAASTWQSGHAPDGRCPKPPGYAVYRCISGNRPRSA